MRVLVISKNSLWLESFLSLANHFSKSLVFSPSGHECQTIIIYTEGFDARTIDRLVLRYNHCPIFLIGTLKNIRKKYKGKVVLVPSGLDVVKTVQLIDLYFGQIKIKKGSTVLNLKEEIVLGLLCDGLTNKEISRYSGLSLSSVKYYLSCIYPRLKIKKRSDPALLNSEIIV